MSKNKSKLNIHFLGGASTVTGSKYLIETDGQKILVDCGMFQGVKSLRMLNWEYLPVDVSLIDCVLLTHGHLDHVGFLPRLVKMGFKGTIYGTAPTIAIAKVILKDSAKIQEEDAERANQKGYSKHEVAEALYTLEDVEKTLEHFVNVHEGQWFDLQNGTKARWQYNGHIIGATFIELDVCGKIIVFSGDIGREDDLLLEKPKRPQKADVLLVESTYGDRLHIEEDVENLLIEIIQKTYARGGNLIIPSFAVERTQTLMYILWKLQERNAIPKMPMIMDSPMGTNVWEIFARYSEWQKLTHKEFDSISRAFTITTSYKETWETIDDKRPKIIVAGSGMITGGRVLTYIKQLINKPETSVLLVGYQAEGTRGRSLLEGAQEIKIHGKYREVKAEIFTCQSLSAHGDQTEMLNWMSEIENPPQKVFLVHGEPHAADAFRVKIKDVLGWEAQIPKMYSIEDLT